MTSPQFIALSGDSVSQNMFTHFIVVIKNQRFESWQGRYQETKVTLTMLKKNNKILDLLKGSNAELSVTEEQNGGIQPWQKTCEQLALSITVNGTGNANLGGFSRVGDNVYNYLVISFRNCHTCHEIFIFSISARWKEILLTYKKAFHKSIAEFCTFQYLAEDHW